ncbi:hypothetical protein G6F65_022787 [Rhizopus arrhizus]|nr:hypothetical protein G6F31_019533 [Rhizopus arrhizus]KAG1242853.1 hypothetical protein G6F65_022787 [Rhizopus arrhizus]
MLGVGHDEPQGQAVGLAAHGTLLHQPAHAKAPGPWGFFRHHLRRAEEEHQVRLQRIEYQRGGDGQQPQAARDGEHAALARRHGRPSPACLRAAWRRARARRHSTRASAPISARVTP